MDEKNSLNQAELQTPRLQEKSTEELEAEVANLKMRLAVAEQQLDQFDKDFAYTQELATAAFYSNAQLASVSELDSGRFLDVNETWVKTRGYTREEAIGRTADELNIWGGPELREKLINDISKHGRLRNYETQSVMRSGEVRDFILNAEVLHINGQRLLFFSGMDITENKKIDKNLQRTQKMEAVGQLTGGIAHDFNNLLAIIQGNLELLEEQLPNKYENLHRLLQSALHGTKRGVNITKKLLSFSSRHAGGNIVINPNLLINETSDLISKSITASVDLKLDLAEDLKSANLDPGEFEDALINLSINAHDAMPDGGCLSIRSENVILGDDYCAFHPNLTPGDYIAVTVEDTGDGMQEDIRDRIFEPFFTTKSSGKGTGLGLSMVFGFVKRSDGHLEVESAPGSGTKFILYFPVAETECKVKVESTSVKKTSPSGSEKILLVDDEVHLLDIANDKLSNLGYQTFTAANAIKALEILSENPDIDLVFTDIVMPGELNGFQLAEKIRHHYPQAKILLTSGYTRSQELLTKDQETALADLMTEMLNKPYTLSQLAEKVRTQLDH
ncbi:response regulator [Sneathiella sp. P13V-1]|uniref:ATP-binding protein n=1 Tax=Sneathiella sp. P13V-1 TaxID=2697366 RepID=UPI00187B1D2A|nr:ATP-binding protein [Sneathiella sp. P13V-1]MBE7637028.1 response regulator [Sneathiella sp. P13V-1]